MPFAALITIKREVKYVDEGSIMILGGVSAGINMSFYIIERFLGEEIARITAKRMEYDIDI